MSEPPKRSVVMNEAGNDPEFRFQFKLHYEETTQHARKRSAISFGGKKMECLDQILILIARWCMQCHLAEPGCNRDSERSEVTPAAFQSLWTSSQEEREQRIICLIFIMKSVCFGSACVWVCLTIFCGQNSPQKLAKCLQRYKLFMNKVHEFMKKC